MKATLNFDLSDAEQRYKHFLCVKAQDMAILIRQLDQWLRNEKKYENKRSLKVDDVRKKIYDLLEEKGMNFGCLDYC